MTVTFLHTGDEHIDSDYHGTINPKTGRNTAWESNYRTVRHIAEHAAERGVNAVVSAGDEFKNGRPSQEAMLMLADAYTPLAEAGIPLLLMDGNHDRTLVPAGHRTAILVLAEILRARGGTVVTSAEPELVEVGGIQVATLPWLNRNAVLAGETVGAAEGDRLVADWALRKLEELASSADPSMPLIMSGHVTVAKLTAEETTGTRRGSEMEMATHVFSEPILDVTRLEQLPYQYGALGHIHTAQNIGTGIYRYAGSLNRFTFTDEPDIKGANLVTLDGRGGFTADRIDTPARVLRTIDLAETDTIEVEEGALVRFLLPEGQADVDKEVRAAVAAHGARVVDTKPRPRQRKQQTATVKALPKSTSAADALRAWAKDNATVEVDTLVAAAEKLNAA